MTTREEIIALAEECGFVPLNIEIIADKAVPMFEAFFHAAQRQAYEHAAEVCIKKWKREYSFDAYTCSKAVLALIERDGK